MLLPKEAMKILFWCFGIFMGGMCFAINSLVLLSSNSGIAWNIFWIAFSLGGSIYLSLVIYSLYAKRLSKSYPEKNMEFAEFKSAEYFQQNWDDMSDEVSENIKRNIDNDVERRMKAYEKKSRGKYET